MWLAAATIGSAIIGGISANKAAKAQTSAGNKQLALQQKVADESTARFQPFVEGGTNAFNALSFESGIGQRPEGYEGIGLSNAGRFALEQGRDTIESGAAARGNLFSGASMKALEKFRMGLVTQDRDNQLNRLDRLAGFGQASAGQQAVVGQNLAAGGSNALAGIGNAQAAGAIGVGNALQSGISNGLELYQYNQTQKDNAFQKTSSGKKYGG